MSAKFPDSYIHSLQQDIINRGIATVLKSLTGKRDRALANSKIAPTPGKKRYYFQWAQRHEHIRTALKTSDYKKW